MIIGRAYTDHSPQLSVETRNGVGHAENSSVERARETLRIVGSGARNRKMAIAVPTQPMAWPMGSSAMAEGDAEEEDLR